MAAWYDERFTDLPGKVQSACSGCGCVLFFPPSKAGKYRTCGGACSEKVRADAKLARQRLCATCGNPFVPRTTQLAIGGGKYCSVACAEPTRALGHTPAAVAKRGASRRARIAAGELVPLRGPASGSWKGGPEAAKQRRRESGKELMWTRRYRKANPEKVREFSHRRSGRKIGRLPRGTVQRIGEAQRWRCAACGGGIKKAFHVDHIIALAAGGQHEPLNIQLLCPRCNVRKSAKHPIDFMQERGYLL